jgi:hypothetical protein
MTAPSSKLTAVTLGVRDVPASARFYKALGFKRKFRATGDEIAFFDAGGVVLALWSRDKLAEAAAASSLPGLQMFGGTTLAWNCATPPEVDAAFATAAVAGAKLLRHPGKTDYGGYRGYLRTRTATSGRSSRRRALRSRKMAGSSFRTNAGFPRHSQARFCRI